MYEVDSDCCSINNNDCSKYIYFSVLWMEVKEYDGTVEVAVLVLVLEFKPHPHCLNTWEQLVLAAGPEINCDSILMLMLDSGGAQS